MFDFKLKNKSIILGIKIKGLYKNKNGISTKKFQL